MDELIELNINQDDLFEIIDEQSFYYYNGTPNPNMINGDQLQYLSGYNDSCFFKNLRNNTIHTIASTKILESLKRI